MKGYDIPIFWNTDETKQLEDMGIEPNLLDFVERVVRFYSVEAITSYEGKYCRIWAGGDSFISPLSMMEVQLLLDS